MKVADSGQEGAALYIVPDPRGAGPVGFPRFSVCLGCPVPEGIMREEALGEVGRLWGNP